MTRVAIKPPPPPLSHVKLSMTTFSGTSLSHPPCLIPSL